VSRLVVRTAMGVEAWAVRRGLAAAGAVGEVAAFGMGRHARDRLSAAGGQLGPDDALAVAGVCGALRPGLLPGDLVVADVVTGPAGPLACPAAPMLAGALRRAGLSAHVGTVVTASGVVTGRARADLAAGGALAVDMESSWLAAAGAGGPVVVVRAVLDGPDHPLVRPATLGRLRTALGSLSAAAGVLAEWAGSLAARELVLAAPASFCAGVERAITAVENTLERHGAPVYVRRQIVHNAHVVADLERRGVVFVEELDEVPAGAVTVFSAHGVAPRVWDEAAELSLRVVDATCPLVSKVHNEVRRVADTGDLLVYIGHPDHDESEGTLGEAPALLHPVATVADVAGLPDAYAEGHRVRYVTQTTLAIDEADAIVAALKRRYGADRVLGPGHADICYATSNRQAAVLAAAEGADLTLVVGSRNSSNSQRLVEVAERAGCPARLVEDAGEVEFGWLTDARRVTLSAGASAPPSLVEELTAALVALTPPGPAVTSVSTRRVATEDINFAPPREVHTV
jgi:4-hydroxy-3-methylbut-2-enyl diphosphate reductase